MKAVRFHDAARLELVQEVRYYARISPVIGRRLTEAVEETVTLARSFPDWRSLPGADSASVSE